jgi:hypothetical protein
MRGRFLWIVTFSLVIAGCGGTPSASPPAATLQPPTALASSPAPVSPAAPTAPLPSPTRPSATAPAATHTLPPPSPTVTETATPRPEAGAAIVIDQAAVGAFDQLPDEWIAAAASIHYLHRASSIGFIINQALDCLQGNTGARRPNYCGDVVDPKFDRSNWDFQERPNPGWIDKVKDFVDQVNLQHDNFQAFGFLVDYVDGQDGMGYPVISDPDNFQTRFVEPLEALEAAYPDKTFVWWTMSLARTGFDNEQKFNEMLREYARSRGKILFDIAAIESHSPEGVKTVDATGREVMFSRYTDEQVAGHPNTEGSERLAKAVWVLMATLAGWPGDAP